MSVESSINENEKIEPSNIIESVKNFDNSSAISEEEKQLRIKEKEKNKEENNKNIQILKDEIIENLTNINKEPIDFNLESNRKLADKIYEVIRFNENPNTLYHFTFNGEGVIKNGFESSKRIDEGIGAMGASLIGTYFFENQKDLDTYIKMESGSKFMTDNKNKKESIIKAVLPKDAKILDSFEDKNEEWLRVRREFMDSFGKPDDSWKREDWEKWREEIGKDGSSKQAQNLTKWLLERGYDAVRLYSSYNGNHPEMMVINEKILSVVKDELENPITPQQKKEAEELYLKYRGTSTFETGSKEDLQAFKEFVSKSKREKAIA